MQCVNCRFENIPGVEACGRCGTSLKLTTAVMDVHPPRALPWVKRLRQWLPFRKARRARSAFAESSKFALNRFQSELDLSIPEYGVLPRMLIPGWAHAYSGQKIRGWLFLAAFLPLLVVGLLTWGTNSGNVLLGLAFSVHVASIGNLMLQDRADWGSRWRAAIFASLFLGCFIYFPMAYMLTRYANSYRMLLSMTPFEQGDVVLVNLAARPKIGSIVLYRVEATQSGNRAPRVYRQIGERVDRILAGPGDRVVWDGRRLLVNDVESPHRPLNPDRLPPKLSLTVPLEDYFIYPSTSPLMENVNAEDTWYSAEKMAEAISIVPGKAIYGVVYFRNQPFSRFGFIR